MNGQLKNSSTAGMIEFILWKFIHKMTQNQEDLVVLSIVNGEEKLEINNLKLCKDIKSDGLEE